MPADKTPKTPQQQRSEDEPHSHPPGPNGTLKVRVCPKHTQGRTRCGPPGQGEPSAGTCKDAREKLTITGRNG